jgi:hydroxymethylpyrimidine pyrophosphatase-like HAD family hydrolase
MNFETDVQAFLQQGRFAQHGAVMTDLDGTAVHEWEGRVAIPPAIELGLKRVHDRGRSVIVNSLRFPLSVMSAFGAEWLRITGTPIPLVSLKGSQIGQVVTSSTGALAFEEFESFPLLPSEINEVMRGIEGMVRDGVDDLLVFFYPRNWQLGENIWTPRQDSTAAVAGKYRSASRVFSSSVTELKDILHSQPMCMIFLLIDLPEDRLMAYQHTHKTSFFAHEGVSKRFGALAMARHLGVDLGDSVGAGDAETDDFLQAVGFAVIVGNADLDYRGMHHTVRVPDVHAWGELLFALGDGVAAAG